jgi:hypothetical protein
MQWSDDTNAGFSTAPADRLIPPVSARVATAMNIRTSSCKRFGRTACLPGRETSCALGSADRIRLGRPPILRCAMTMTGSTVITLVNLSDQAVKFQLCGVECVEVIDVVADGNFDAPHGDSPVAGSPALWLPLASTATANVPLTHGFRDNSAASVSIRVITMGAYRSTWWPSNGPKGPGAIGIWALLEYLKRQRNCGSLCPTLPF